MVGHKTASESFYTDFFNIQEIVPGLWIGPGRCARDLKTLQKNKITHVLVTNFDKFWHIFSDISYLGLRVEDSCQEDIFSSFECCFDFLEEGREKGGVLVHCTAGISRSSTICISYLMKKYSLSFASSLSLVSHARPWVLPNPFFQKQLVIYERILYHSSPFFSLGENSYLLKKREEGKRGEEGGEKRGEEEKEEGERERVKKEGCELCEMEKRTTWYTSRKKGGKEEGEGKGEREGERVGEGEGGEGEDEDFLVLECDSCDLPMAVWRSHTMSLTVKQEERMTKALSEVADKLLGKGSYFVDKNQRMIPDHLHWHARPMDNWWYAVYAANEKKRIEEKEKEEREKEEEAGEGVDEVVGRGLEVGVGEVLSQFLDGVVNGSWKVGMIEISSSPSSPSSPSAPSAPSTPSSPSTHTPSPSSTPPISQDSLISFLFSSKEVFISVASIYPSWCTITLQTTPSPSPSSPIITIALAPTSPQPSLPTPLPSPHPSVSPIPSLVSPLVAPREFNEKEKSDLVGKQGRKQSFVSPFRLDGKL